MPSDGKAVCRTCGYSVEICPDCSGRLCSDGCPDRERDGCVCMILLDEQAERDEEAVV